MLYILNIFISEILIDNQNKKKAFKDDFSSEKLN